jgi:hypothetical protein
LVAQSPTGLIAKVIARSSLRKLSKGRSRRNGAVRGKSEAVAPRDRGQFGERQASRVARLERQGAQNRALKGPATVNCRSAAGVSRSFRKLKGSAQFFQMGRPAPLPSASHWKQFRQGECVRRMTSVGPREKCRACRTSRRPRWRFGLVGPNVGYLAGASGW